MTRWHRFVWAGFIPFATQGGCIHGPAAMHVGHARYNEAIHRTTSEQLLLNLLRLKYREPVLFLDIGSVAAQFTFRQAGGVGATLNENVGAPPINPDILRLSGDVTYQEQPTITFTPLQGDDFVNRLLTPLRLETIVLLARSGWSIDRVLRLTVQQANGLDNATSASGPTPAVAPQYEAFARMSRAFRNLQRDGRLVIGYDVVPTVLSKSVPAVAVSAADVIQAAREGYRFRPIDDGSGYALWGETRRLSWRIPPAAADTPEVREIVDLLGLAPDRNAYDIRARAGDSPSGAPPGSRTEINITPRSLMGTLFYLSQAIETPESHARRGVVTTTLDRDGQPFDWKSVTGDLLRVHVHTAAGDDPAVSVRYRGHRFYIDDTDLSSKATFSLLGQLFALQAGSEPGATPVLTLPIGG